VATTKTTKTTMVNISLATTRNVITMIKIKIIRISVELALNINHLLMLEMGKQKGKIHNL
jgi:hypothetical protein